MVEPRGGNGVICLGFDERAVLRTTLGSKRWRRKKDASSNSDHSYCTGYPSSKRATGGQLSRASPLTNYHAWRSSERFPGRPPPSVSAGI